MKFHSDTLNSFMNSVMNIEYVYLIILGLNQFNRMKLIKQEVDMNYSVSTYDQTPNKKEKT